MADSIDERLKKLEQDHEALATFVGRSWVMAGPRYLFAMNNLTEDQVNDMLDLLEDVAETVDDGEPVDVASFVAGVQRIAPEVVARKPDFAGRVANWAEADPAYKRLHDALLTAGLPGIEVLKLSDRATLYNERRMNRLKRWDERHPDQEE